MSGGSLEQGWEAVGDFDVMSTSSSQKQSERRHWWRRRFSPKMAPFWLQLCCVLLFTVVRIGAEELAPPYFNLADNRRIYASATCGEDVTGPELYCKLVGASSSSTSGTSPEHEIIGQVIQGQVSMQFSFKAEKCC